jgi:hypothetical protein
LDAAAAVSSLVSMANKLPPLSHGCSACPPHASISKPSVSASSSSRLPALSQPSHSNADTVCSPRMQSHLLRHSAAAAAAAVHCRPLRRVSSRVVCVLLVLLHPVVTHVVHFEHSPDPRPGAVSVSRL